MRLSLIVALTREGVIGRDGTLQWKLSDDLRRFKALTMGHCLVMGRKTLESLGRLLPGRTSIVLSRQDPVHLSAKYAGVRVAHSLEDALAKAAGDNELFIIGGGEVFAQALPLVSRLYITWVEEDVPGDVYFTGFVPEDWQLIQEEYVPADERNEYATTYCVYDRFIRWGNTVPAIPAVADETVFDQRLAEMLAANGQLATEATPTATATEFSVSSLSPSVLPIMTTTSPSDQELSQLNELLQLNQKLLTAIVNGDWTTYANLCDPSITCFEPEARGELVIGMAFHKYYFDLPAPKTSAAKNVTMAQPHVRVMGDAAVLSYVRLTQSLDGNGAPQTSRVEETRVWQKIGGSWKHVHFHRAFPA